MEKYYYIAGAIVAVIVLFAVVRYYLAHRKAVKQTYTKSGINIDTLLNALGGKENIKSVDSTMSKVTVELVEKKNINVDTIKALGASGIVQNQSKLSMIFGKVSETVSMEIKEKL